MIFGINTSSDISNLLYVISRAVGRVRFKTNLKYHEWYFIYVLLPTVPAVCSNRSSSGCFLEKAQWLLIIHNPVTQFLHKKNKVVYCLLDGREYKCGFNATPLLLQPRLVLCGLVRRAVFTTNLRLIRQSLFHIGGERSVTKMGESLTRKIFLLHGIHKANTDKYLKDRKVADETHKEKGLYTLGVSA